MAAPLLLRGLLGGSGLLPGARLFLTLDGDKLARRLEKEFPRKHKKAGERLLRAVAKETLREFRKRLPPRRSGTLNRSVYVKLLRARADRPLAIDLRIRTGKRYQDRENSRRRDKDGFYWRFLDKGTKFLKPRNFTAETLRVMQPRLARHFAEYRDELRKQNA
jgi:hypothetical protein